MRTVAAGAPPRVGVVTRARALWSVCSLALIAVSVESTYTLATGGSKLLLVLPISALVGLGLVVLGAVNFEMFTYTVIALRASLDIAKPQDGNSGSAGVATASASGLDPAGGLAVLFMLAALFWYFTRRASGQRAPKASVHRVCLIIFAAVGYLSIIDSSLPVVSLLEAIRVSAVVTMLTVMEVLISNRDGVKRLITSIYISSVLPIGLTLYSVLTHHAQFSSGGFDRYQGTFSQPNPFAIYLCMLIVMGVALFPYTRRGQRVFMTAILVGAVICLYYTYTRSAWVAAVIGVVSVCLMSRRRALIGAMAVAAIVAVVAVPTIQQRFTDLFATNSVNAAGNTSNSLAWRFDYWGQVLPLADKDPITGIGLKMSSYGTVQAKEPHNDFLRAYVETGVVGLLAYLLLLVSMAIVAREGVRRAMRGYDRSVAIGFAGNVIAFVLISIVSNVITEVIVLWYYVAFAAAAYAVTLPRYKEQEEPELSVADRRREGRAAERAQQAAHSGGGAMPQPSGAPA